MARDSVLWLLAGGVVFFVLVTFGTEYMLPKNDRLFGMLSGGFGSFLGGLMLYIKGHISKDDTQ